MSTTGKKQRVSIACVSCRRKKCRCDGQKPVCNVCEREGKVCEYTHHLEKRKPPTKCYIHALHSRISHLELLLSQNQENMKTHASSAPDSALISPSTAEDLTSFRPDFIYSGAYGHLSISKGLPHEQQDQEQERPSAHMPCPREYPFLLEPGIQAQLLTEYWTWQSAWPLLIHQPLFCKDLSENGASGYSTSAVLSALLALAAQHADFTLIDHRFPDFDKTASIYFLVQSAKTSVLDQIERPSLSLAIASCLISIREMSVDNMAAAFQYIGIAVRHIYSLGPHKDNLNIENPSMTRFVTEFGQALSVAKMGIWMVEKHLTQAMGQPSSIQESDYWPISLPILPNIEYSMWPPSDYNLTPQIISSCISNFQYACDLLRMVSTVLHDIYAQQSPLSFEEKEDRVTKAHVAMSEYYNNLPSSLRLPPSITTMLPPHVFQFNLLYHGLKIMLHRPFIRIIPSMKTLQDLQQSSKALHLQSATFSAIRITYIVKSFEKFFSVNRLSPFTITALTMSSFVHLFNATSKDLTLSQRSKYLQEKNLHTLRCMSATTKFCAHAIRTLQSIARDWDIPIYAPQEDSVSHRHLVESHMPTENKATDEDPTVELQPSLFQAPYMPELSTAGTGNLLNPVDSFDWFELPLIDRLMDDGSFFDSWCAQDERQYGCLENVDTTPFFT